MSDESETRSKHLDQSPPIEWHAKEHNGQTFIIRDVPEGSVQLYLASAKTRNIKTLATADAVIYRGNVVETVYDEDARTVEFVHDYAGNLGFKRVGEWLDDPAIRLKKITQSPTSLLGQQHE